MSDQLPVPAASNTFERIKRVEASGAEFWSARELARVLEYTDFRNFVTVINKAREACANSGQSVSDHFVDINEMVNIGSGAQRPIEDWALSRYACYLVIQNADPGKPLVALGQNVWNDVFGVVPSHVFEANVVLLQVRVQRHRLTLNIMGQKERDLPLFLTCRTRLPHELIPLLLRVEEGGDRASFYPGIRDRRHT